MDPVLGVAPTTAAVVLVHWMDVGNLSEQAMHFHMHLYIHHWLAMTASLLLCISPLVVADEAADRSALEAAAQAWSKAFNARDADALAALATQDIVLMDSNATRVSGREAARGALQQAFTSTGQITTTTKEAVIVGDVAWRIGALASKLPNGAVESRGQSLEIWQRVNGQWRLHRQMSSNLLARPGHLPRPPLSEPVLEKLGD
jgi:ketosteroid isomerase-like protein